MDERLQQAIAAIRTHDNQKAQQLLAQFLKSNPNHAQGWFLLSQVVSDRKQQVSFLNKTLTLEPTHRLARQKLTELGESLPEPPVTISTVPATPVVGEPVIPVSPGYADFAEQAEAKTIPSWLAGQKVYQTEEPVDVPPDMILEPAGEETPMPNSDDIPVWLKETPTGEWSETDKSAELPKAEPEPVITEPVPTVSKKAPVTKAPKTTDTGIPPLPWYFWIMALFALVIFVMLLLQVFSLFS